MNDYFTIKKAVPNSILIKQNYIYYLLGLMLVAFLSPNLVAQNSSSPIYKQLKVRSQQLKYAPIKDVFTPIEPGAAQRRAVFTELEACQFLRVEDNSILMEKPDVLRIPLDIKGIGDLTLKLYKVHLYSKGERVKIASDDSAYLPMSYNSVHYWGVVDGRETRSIASISVSSEGLVGMVSMDNKTWEIGKLQQGENYILYEVNKLKKELPPLCSGGIKVPGADLPKQNNDIELAMGDSMVDNCVRVHIEVDNDIYNDKGDIDATRSFVEGIFSQVAILYANEGLKVKISEIYIWDEPSPYDPSKGGDNLSLFQAEMNQRGFLGDIAHLVNYGHAGGVAWLNTLCSPYYAYAYSGIGTSYNIVPTYSWTVNVFAHEMGHNIGSPHTHACAWNGNNTPIDCCGPESGYPGSGCAEDSTCTIPLPESGTIMSYCHLIGSVGIDFQEGFHDQVQALLKEKVRYSYCVATCSGDPLVANFEQDKVSFCEGEEVQFTDISSGDIVSYHWFFPGGIPAESYDENPLIRYISSGTYDVKLLVVDYYGDTSRLTIPNAVQVHSPDIDPVVIAESCLGACDGSISLSSGVSYEWSTGDTVAFLDSLCRGFYYVTVTDSIGCANNAKIVVHGGDEIVRPEFSYDSLLCTNDGVVELPTESDNGISGVWAGEIVNENKIETAASGEGSWYISFVPDTGQCLTGIISKLITISPAPIADAGPDKQLPQNSATVDVCAVEVQNASYHWSNENGHTEEGRCVSLGEGNWILTVEDKSTGCTALDTISVSMGTAVINPSVKVRIYPNPADDYLYIDVSGNADYTVQAFNLFGELILDQPNVKRLFTGNLPAGVYYVHIVYGKDNSLLIRRMVIIAR